MTFEEYQVRTYVAIQPHENKKDEILNWAIGLSEEIGEVMNHLKHGFWGGEQLDRVELAKEVGDILWYVSALSSSLELDLSTVAELNVSKLEHRFGKSFDNEKSQARHQLEKKFGDTEQYRLLMGRLFACPVKPQW